MPRTLNIALIPGDGIGTEVVAEAMKVLAAIAPAAELEVRTTEYDLGARRYNATGELLPDEVVEELRGYDAILLGAIGDPSVAPGILERGVLLPLRFVMDHHVNLRPVKLYPGVTSGPLAGKGPEDIDFVVCREGTEGPYVGAGGTLRKGTPHEVSTEVSINTAYGAERIIRDAFERAMRRRQEGHARPQDQRARPCRPDLAAGVRPGQGRVPRGRRPTTATSTRPRCSS